MTVATSTSKSGPYAGAGTTGPFTVTFRFLENSHLQVIKTSTAGIDSTLALTTDYAVSGAGASTGTVTLVSALLSGEKLTIIRNVPFTQEADYVQNDAFPAESHERALDKLTMETQQLKEATDRSIKLPPTSTEDVDALTADLIRVADSADNIDTLANNISSVNTNAANIAAIQTNAANITDIQNASENAALVVSATAQAVDGEKDLFTAGVNYTKGTTTQLTLTYAPAKSGTVKVFFDGVFQHLTEWSLAVKVITFTAAIAADKVEVHYVIPSQFVGLSNADLLVLGEAEAAAQAAQVAAEFAQSNAESAQTAAVIAKVGAEAARDAANAVGKVFTTTALGIAGTTSGQSFSVLSADLQDLIVYTNSAGTAVELFRFRTKAWLDSLGFDTTYTTRSGYAAAWVDQSNRIALAITTDGKVVLGNGVNVSDALASFESLFSTPAEFNRSGYSWVWEDSTGKVAGGLDASGDLISKGVNVTGLARPSAEFDRSGYSWVWEDIYGKVAGGLDSAGNLISKGLNVTELLGDPAIDYQAQIDAVKKWITPSGFYASGDSLTAGAGGTPYPTQLATLLGKSVQNGGVGGQSSTQIAGRFGGVVPLWTISGNTIPTSGGVTVTAQSSTLHNNQGPGTINGTLNGVYGAFTFDNVSVYTFTRSTAGSTVYVEPQTPFIVDTSDLRNFKTVIIWQGRNNVTDPTQIKKDIAATIEFIKTQDKRFVVLSVLNTNTETVGTTNYNTIVALNDELKALYPRNYIDVRKLLVRSYNPSIPQDVTDFGNDVPPSSLRSDAIHLNTAGYGIVANAVYSLLTLKGWTS